MTDRPTRPRRMTPDPDPEFIAIQALTYIAGEPERADRFLALSGIGPGELRRAASDPEFLLGVMDHVVGDEPLLIEVAARAGVAPETVVRAHARMNLRR